MNLSYGDRVVIRRDATSVPGAGTSDRGVIGEYRGEYVEGDGSHWVRWPITNDWRSERTMRLWGSDLRPLRPNDESDCRPCPGCGVMVEPYAPCGSAQCYVESPDAENL